PHARHDPRAGPRARRAHRRRPRRGRPDRHRDRRPPEGGGHLKKILVVDDLPYLREVQVLLLNEAGYQTTALGDAREALEPLPDLKPDLILLDVAMPGMDGREFLAPLREHPRWRRVPVRLTPGPSLEVTEDDTGYDELSMP